MNRFLTAIVVVLILASPASAGPFAGRRSRVPASPAHSASSCGSAQSHAEAMAAAGRMWHTAAVGFFEGVGYGSSPEAALQSCCKSSGAVIDQGVARGRSGQYFACVRRK